MQEIELRPYQEECINIINNIEPGAYLVVLATALGKTVIFSHIDRPGRMLIVSHREELVYQPKKYFNCSFGVERAEEVSSGEDVISASVQSLIHRLDKFSPEDFDIIIVDEAHHSIAPSYRKIIDYFHPRLLLGFTATPNRADNVHLGDIYSKIIYERNIKWGIQNNWLSDIECFKINIGYDLRNVHTRMGDFANNELDSAVNIEECNKTISEIYNEYAVGPTLIFAASVEHAKNIASFIPGAEVITHKTENRSEILERFRNGEIRCIVNNLILTEGTDLPMVQTIMIARPTKNISLYIQMVGRGTRLYQGKDKLRLIDLVGVSGMDMCTAPVLFGIDPEIAAKTKQDNGLLSDMEERIEDVQNDLIFNRDFYIYNAELINMFSEKGNYNVHGINFTVLGNKDLVCSIGDKKMMRITAADTLGNSSLMIKEKNDPILFRENIKTQQALDEAYDILNKDYAQNRSLWDKNSVDRWGMFPASEKQKTLILKMYKLPDLLRMKVNMNELTKYQASILISRKFGENS